MVFVSVSKVGLRQLSLALEFVKLWAEPIKEFDPRRLSSPEYAETLHKVDAVRLQEFFVH